MQAYPILQTKLYIPSIRSDLVSRPRLLERLNAGLNCKLTLISTPAGFGKTTLVSEWVSHFGFGILDSGLGSLQERAIENPTSKIVNRVAWLSLDEGDNDPTRFLVYLVAALQTIEADIGRGALSALQSPQPPPDEAVLIPLINEIAAIPDRIVLVLDDYHLIEAQPIQEVLAFLLEHLPPQMHLVIVSREDPPLPLARLRARGQLIELRATDLRFASSEAAEFLNRVMGLGLSMEDIAALEARTEGWIVGLQLASLALQGTISMQGRKDTATPIESFTGSHRFVLDYLVEEVLQQQSESVQDFLLRTAILDRLTGSLCDALTGHDDGQATLEMLQLTNLFIVFLDDERCWYRYHHLFADLLRQRLRQKRPDWVPTLHNRASEWYEQNGFVDQAIEHALRAEDFERAAYLIEEHVDALWMRGRQAKLRRWLAGLPDDLVFSKPHLGILHAWDLFASGQQDEAEQSLQAAEHALDTCPDLAIGTSPGGRDQPPDFEGIKIRGRAATVRAFAALERALTLAKPGGFIRIFVDEGSPMAHLLYAALARGISPDYVCRLLAAFPVVEPEKTAPASAQVPQSELIEPLSEREIEVLQLIAEGLTNREIAARLFLSQNTVKVHSRNIYGKLGAHNRTQALARAQALGILAST